jgi:3-oxoacyl-[acyl-carrier-protein] synthase-3
MRYNHVCLESLGYTLPQEIVTSADLEQRLQPAYERLRLPEGRLELITGVRERRFWPPDTLPGQVGVLSAQAALRAAAIDRRHVQALIHASVCRDYLEPATACAIHHCLKLPAESFLCDVSNACLGLLNAIVQVANMIELGQIQAGLVVGTEASRQLVETTIGLLNEDLSLTRDQMKLALASLTIGSGSCAILLVHERVSRTGNRLLAATVQANTAFHGLCHSGNDSAVGPGMEPLMWTDSGQLLQAGIATGADVFPLFLREVGWDRDDIDRTFCHQVGSAHRKLMLESLRLDPRIDFTTVEWLGNTGSVALPLTMALGSQRGHLGPGERVAMLGIGSGINCLMLGCQWQASLVEGGEWARR